MTAFDPRTAAANIVQTTCEEQGLPPKVTDPLVLARVARLIASSEEAQTRDDPLAGAGLDFDQTNSSRQRGARRVPA